MNVKTWLAGTAFAALMAANTASAGELYIANLRGSTESPPTTAPYTGTGYLVLNNANTGITSWFTHDIPAGRPYQGQIERADGSALFRASPC